METKFVCRSESLRNWLVGAAKKRRAILCQKLDARIERLAAKVGVDVRGGLDLQADTRSEIPVPGVLLHEKVQAVLARGSPSE